MKIHEYQAKAILAKYGVPVPQGEVVSTAAEAGAGTETGAGTATGTGAAAPGDEAEEPGSAARS